jgi:uncharacterized protein with NAD-binding domain and iron-sulfur cluster
MKENDILTEIRRTREELARRFHFHIPALIAHLRKGEQTAESAGRKVVSYDPVDVKPTATTVREEPPQP